MNAWKYAEQDFLQFSAEKRWMTDIASCNI